MTKSELIEALARRQTHLAFADVELAAGTVPVTLPFCSGADAESVCLTFSNPAALSLSSASVGLKAVTSGTSCNTTRVPKASPQPT